MTRYLGKSFWKVKRSLKDQSGSMWWRVGYRQSGMAGVIQGGELVPAGPAGVYVVDGDDLL